VRASKFRLGPSTRNHLEKLEPLPLATIQSVYRPHKNIGPLTGHDVHRPALQPACGHSSDPCLAAQIDLVLVEQRLPEMRIVELSRPEAAE